MDKKRTSHPSTLWLIAALVTTIGLMSLSLVVAKSRAAEEPNKMTMSESKNEEAMESKHKEKMEKMHKCTEMCTKKCQTNMMDISEAKASIKMAIEAIDKGDMAAAKSELEKADKLLTTVHKSMEENIEKMPCANSKCPISGKEFDNMNVPKDRTRMYKGMKIGFCCPMCPPEWDKLTDEQKDAKLKEVMPPK
jgi:hypothetical protein